jgi:predicted ATPase with chaperone activity
LNQKESYNQNKLTTHDIEAQTSEITESLDELARKGARRMNPCPCGYCGDPTHECTCSMQTTSRYQKRISGPLLDRIDIHVEVPRVDMEKLTADRLGGALGGDPRASGDSA